MGSTNNIAELPWRRDLDQRVAINPDEAGRFDQWISGPENDENVRNELDLITDSGSPTGAEIVEIEYALASTERSAYEARIVGYPPNSDMLSKWTVYFYVKE
jgi:hypothetical protein